MRKAIICLLILFSVWLVPPSGGAKEVAFTLEDRARLIQLEVTLREFKDSVDKRFAQVDKRFDQMMTFMWILASIFGSLVAVTISFATWDRRTTLSPVLRYTRELERRDERIERALRLLAEKDLRVAEALRQVGLL